MICSQLLRYIISVKISVNITSSFSYGANRQEDNENEIVLFCAYYAASVLLSSGMLVFIFRIAVVSNVVFGTIRVFPSTVIILV
jgi:hypothetical protein